MTSLKGRLIAAATIWIVLGMVAASLVQSAIFTQHVTEQFHEELFVHLDELQRLATIDQDGIAHLQRPLSDPRYDVARSGFYWEVQREGAVLARSASLEGPSLVVPDDKPKDVAIHTHTIAGPTGPLVIVDKLVWPSPEESPLRFVIGTDQRHLQAVLSSFNTSLAMSSAAFGLSLVAASALLIAFALRPLKSLRASLERVRGGEAGKLEGQFPSEVQPLVQDLNALLGSTGELIQRARTQAGNMAHGLKSPLAILMDEGYRLADIGQKDASSTILSECRKMQTHIDYQIARARAVATRSSPGIVADGRVAAAEVASALSRMYREKQLKFDIQVPDAIPFACDPADLNEMLANLVDNACKHARSTVRVMPGADRASLIVEDDGPGLPPEALEVVFNIGERWDSQTPGSGLGLAIVRDLARLYGGDVHLGTSRLGGVRAVLELPLPRT
ncbi:MAG: HAMP domain-containing sensor histidine kinase [Hyphomicrobium sp.]|nr:HAMP domain-containing sensor histidine kinase [Hyphomicrobium sp.]